MAFSPDGHFLASGSYESSVVRLWDANSGTLAHIFEGHSSPVNSVIFSPDSRMLVSCSCDHTICLWDLVMGTVQKTISHSHTVYSVAFSPGGRLLASCSDHKVRLWDVATGVLQQTFEGSDSADLRLNSLDGFTSAAFSPDGRLLASGSHCGIVCIWDLATGALRHLIDGHSNWVHPLVFSPDSALLATGSIDRTVCLWALTGSVLNRIGSWEFIEDFCVDGLYLQTGLGFLDIDISFSPSVNLNVSIEDEKWIKINGERILWLPVGSRPSCFKVKGNTLALGHALGEVSFIRFCI
jgi:WD40 repeat protein